MWNQYNDFIGVNFVHETKDKNTNMDKISVKDDNFTLSYVP